jgi:DNA-binding transcriptional MerR regulator/methylmalonyl-CoA mutase cobalamin-binding subunit
MTSRDSTPSTSEDPRHPIQVVARRTGLTTDVLRAWEKRYGAVEPQRVAGGRRLYSDADIERLILLRRATAAGRRIGDVAGLPTAELVALASEDDVGQAASPGTPRPSTTSRTDEPEALIDAAVDAIEHFDQPALERVLGRARLALSTPRLLNEVIAPLLERVGERWLRGELRPAHEHLLTATIRSMIGPVGPRPRSGSTAPLLVVTTPAEQWHELGALMAAIMATTAGWRVSYLGPSLPAEEIAAVAHEQSARAVALSLVYPEDDVLLANELRRLRLLLDDGVTLVAGGRAAAAYSDLLHEIGALRIEDLGNLARELDRLRG